MEYAGTNSFNQKLYKYDVNTAANFIIFNYNGTEYKGAFSDVNNAYYWDGELKSYLLDVEPTTEGTTEAPTTEAPTTEAPTTEAPTTEAPTTQASVLEDGFYLAGVKGWTAADLVGYKFSANPGAENEYMLNTTLTKGDSIKVVKVESDAITAYYPALGDNYVVTDETAGDVTIYFKEAYSDEWKDFGGHIWIAVKEEPSTAAPTTEAPTTEAPTTEAPTTEAPTTAPAIADGFYLAGVKGWTVTDLAGYKFEANPGAENEYMLNTTLTKGDSIKVVKVESDAITAYYPALGDNYVVTDETAGDVTIYFKEAYSDEWKDFGGHIWIAVQAEPEEDYEVTYTYNYDGEDVTVTKTIKAKASEIEAKIEANVPAINNQINTYSFDGAVKGEGNKYTAALKAVAKEYTVTINGNDLEGTYKYMDKATVNSDTDVAFVVDGQVVAYGKSYTFYVIGDTDVTTDATKTLADFASISKTAEIAADGKVTVELLASAVVEKFERMGIAFASSEKTADQIKDDVLAITAGTAKGTNVAVHNSSVTEANESGQYQFVYAPYITNGYNGKLYFYTFAVNSDNEVIVSAASEVDYATITK